MEQSLNPTWVPPQPKEVATSTRLGLPAYVYAVVFSSFCVIAGIIWDICWHRSIGRDGLFSPPHLLVYLGAIVAGLFSGYQVLKTTFAGSDTQKSQSVKVWGFFYSSLGALFCIWGAIAMLTSAPFDDWWHSTYGLDVTILSPPHTVLALGIIGVQFGAMVTVLALRNQTKLYNDFTPEERRKRDTRIYWMFVLSAGFLLSMWFTLISEELGKWSSHNSSYYQFACGAFPLFLLAFGRAIPNRWTITTSTAVYTAMLCLTLWIIPLFPAEPKLGPILHRIDHYQGFEFPLLLIVPALAMDWLLMRYAKLNDWLLALIVGVAFFAIFFVVHWYFGAFLMESPYSRNWIFGSHFWYFGNDPNWEYRYKFAPWTLQETPALLNGLAIALGLGIVSSRIGLAWGNWMNKIQR
ncbi:hypothetical protein [Telluribacter sp.]|jgi:hypothetical protein|uniref:hypothetical protein n=1 Tax=Telluribacter sp. TaxID=1978767 RepID=UPI002E135F1A|nr:hypothetical protein [Telluribacter sp.]